MAKFHRVFIRELGSFYDSPRYVVAPEQTKDANDYIFLALKYVGDGITNASEQEKTDEPEQLEFVTD